MNWHSIAETVLPYLFKIETPGGHGTGFLCVSNKTSTVAGIATAYHVVEHADRWRQPIRILHQSARKAVFLEKMDRVVLGNAKTDSAVILFKPLTFKLPSTLLPLLQKEKHLKIGVEVGWLGFPAIEPDTPCFFSGNVSARQKESNAYLIDGVAINGVSGGPVFYEDSNRPEIIGAITAYIANRATGDTLPGLAYARDVSHFHDIAIRLKSLEEASQQKKNLEQEIVPSSEQGPEAKPSS